MRLLRALPFALFATLGLTNIASAGGTPTVYDNHNLHLMGSRAAGMGGAYTALACDEAALHYNPASLACAQHSHLELVANAYMIQSLAVPRALGEGQDLSATTYHSVPSAVGAVYVVSDGDPETRVRRQAFAFLITIPSTLALKAEPTSATTRDFLTTSVRDDVLAGDVGYAYQVLPELSFGLSLGGAIRTMSSSSTILVTRPIRSGGNEFVSLGQEIEALSIGLHAKVGARWTPSPNWALGLQLKTPSLDVYGTYKQSTSVGVAGFDANTGAPILDATPVRFTGKSAASFPMRVAVGAAYLGNGYTLSADLSLGLPRDVRVAHSVVPIRIANAPEGTPSDLTLERVLQPNVNLGAEVFFTRSLAVGLGAFTDFSSVPKSTLEEDRVHMFGGSTALTVMGTQTRGTFGVSFSYGMAESVVQTGQFTLDSLDSSRTGLSTITRWNVVGMIGSNYSFLPDDVAAGAMKKQKEPPASVPVPAAPAP